MARPVMTIASISVVTLARAASMYPRCAATALMELSGTRVSLDERLSEVPLFSRPDAASVGSASKRAAVEIQCSTRITTLCQNSIARCQIDNRTNSTRILLRLLSQWPVPYHPRGQC